jgi:membrane protein implicated in regulation of membrane protease activity
MYLIVIGWMYVAVLMAVAEATASNGSLLGAAVTLVLYGLLPAGLLAYIFGTPARKAKRRREEQAAQTLQTSAESHDSDPMPGLDPNASRHAPSAPQD